MLKPSKCNGCPFFGDGQGFVPDLIRDESEVFIYAQNPGECEEEGKRYTGTNAGGDHYEPHKEEPLIGKTGFLQDRTFLPLAGLDRGSVSLGNSIRCRFKHGNELPPLASVMVREAMQHCHNAYFKLPAKTKLIVAQGEYSLFALTQHGMTKYDKVGDWRGYVLPFQPIGSNWTFDGVIWNPGNDSRIPVLATYHLAYLSRDPTATLISKRDWMKVREILSGKWPKKLPTIQDGPPQVWPVESAFDTEFVPENKHFLCYSLAYPLKDGEIRVRVSDKLDPGFLLQDAHHVVVMHNADADIPFLEAMNVPFTFEDTMHAHAVLWSDFAHDLGFLGSMYGSLNRWKHLDKTNPVMYSAGDAYGTWEAWEAIKREFSRDPASERVYRTLQLPLVPIIMAAESAGIRINPERAREAYAARQEKIDRLNSIAQAAVGWPINLRSNDQVKKQLFEIEGLLNLIQPKRGKK